MDKTQLGHVKTDINQGIATIEFFHPSHKLKAIPFLRPLRIQEILTITGKLFLGAKQSESEVIRPAEKS